MNILEKARNGLRKKHFPKYVYLREICFLCNVNLIIIFTMEYKKHTSLKDIARILFLGGYSYRSKSLKRYPGNQS